MSNISPTGERRIKFIALALIVAFSACASSGKRRLPPPLSAPAHPTAPGPKGPEVYGPFPGGDVGPIPGQAAPLEIVPDPDRIVLVLDRGLTRGYAHVGVLKALHDLKVPIQSIYATEVGALAAALYYTQPNPNRVDWALLRFTEKNLGSSEGRFSFRLKSPETNLEEKLREVFGSRRVETLTDRLHLLLEDAKTGQTLEAKSGELWRAVRGALSGANGYSPTDFEGRSVRASTRKLSEEYRIARQAEKHPVVVVSTGEPPAELFRKLVEGERAVLLYVPLDEINDRDLKMRNQAVFAGKSAVQKAAKEILGLIGRKLE